MSLRDRYPRLYSNATIKEDILDDFYFWIKDQWQWSIPWRRDWFK